MSVALRRFSPRDLLFPPASAWEILRFFFPGDVVGIYPEDLSLEDRLFAQALLVAALDETRALGTREAAGEVPLVAAGYIRIRPVAARLVARAPETWFDLAAPEGGDAARIDETARAAVSIRHRAGWLAHVRGGPLL
jgi:hypothetical protein